MKKVVLSLGLVMTAYFLQAQSKEELTIKKNDSIILADIITPLLSDSENANQEPDWAALESKVKNQYGKSYTDRTVTKAKIYYFYGKDWASFSKALVHYTEAFEDKNDLKLMNKNAKMVLQYSQSPEEWKTAQSWAKRASDGEPNNDGYKETLDALKAKIRG